MIYKIAVATLNQFSLDFEGNKRRIIESITEAHTEGAIYRTGGELELSGYSLEDGFFENDTTYHCWQSLRDILDETSSLNILIDVGMPVRNKSLYNCRVICYKGRVLFIRAKTILAREGIYREQRHFHPWTGGLVPFELPYIVAHDNKTQMVPFGTNFVLDLSIANSHPLRIGWEICQELWDIKNVSSDLYQNFGCHLVVNSSGSYWELRKLNITNDVIKGISLRAQACYAYSNLVGCDGQRYVFSGRSCIYHRGQLVRMMPIKSLHETYNITYDLNPEEVDENRAQSGIRPDLSVNDFLKVWNLSSNSTHDSLKIDSSYKVMRLDITKCQHQEAHLLATKVQEKLKLAPEQDESKATRFTFDTCSRPEEEIHCFVTMWLWDYLRRSSMKGFIIPLSGGLDSSAVAILVYCLCCYLHEKIQVDDLIVSEYFEKVHNIPRYLIKSQLTQPADICKRILKCCYLATRHSGRATQDRASRLCSLIGAAFSLHSIDSIYEACKQIELDADIPANNVNLLDQNLQARLRMTMIYRLSGGNKIVLATGNVDEGLMGYLTKYDCSSADINPIGGLCKEDLKSFLSYCCSEPFRDSPDLIQVLHEIILAPPSAELTGADQRDEDEIGLTYNEISVLGKVRRGIFGCSGPEGAFKKVWRHRNVAPFNTKIRCLMREETDIGKMAFELGELIKRFYQRYTRNRHKLTVLTPALHAESYSPDDNRFDHRQFLFPPMTLQFACVDQMVTSIKTNGQRPGS